MPQPEPQQESEIATSPERTPSPARLRPRDAATLIVLDRRGNAGVAWNTPAMAFAVWPRGATEIEDGPRE